MDAQFLRYSKEIDTNIVRALEFEMNVHVLGAKKTEGGEFNYSYKITTDKDTLIARVFRERNEPPDGKLEWVEGQLSDHKIPHAKMLYYSRDETFFPYGFMVAEFLEGKDGKRAIMDGDISFADFFDKLAPLLQQIHSITTIGFGEIRNGRGEYNTYYDSKLGLYERIKDRLSPLADIEVDVHERVLQEVLKLQQYEGLFESVLLHGDPPPGNSIVKPDGGIILIDWDNVKCGSWIDEYVGLVTRGAFMWEHELSEEERNKIIQVSFKNHYNGVDFDNPNLLEVMKILEILNAYSGIAVHYYQHEDMSLYDIAKKRVEALLSRRH
jgi:aminoglycoside phosphotransferase (APT) family kinase protein